MSDDLVGQNLGKYRIVARLGAGGMAEVYKAYQPGLDRHVAIKLMKSHIASQKGSARRFEREAVAVARLRHPNIVQVHDFDAYGDLRYMVMEFIDGPTLRSELEERRNQSQTFTLAEIARIFVALTSAIDYAHAQGIIHHDLKPDNVMITPSGQIVLTDFGIARMVDVAQQTETDLVAGTPAYMAPEQSQGELSDKRSDIYSLGVILFELATGQVPFQGENPLSIIVQHIKEAPPAPTTINANIPQPVEKIILKSLNKKPAERYQTAGELGVTLWQTAGVTAEQEQPSTSFISAVAAAPQLQEISITPDRPLWSTSTPIPPCPYRGLFAFQEEDAPFFFGREAFTAQLVEAVHEQPLVAVLGPSGSGKSSVVFAGLIPRLRQESPTATESEMFNWRIASLRPGQQPFQALAAALLPHLQPDLNETDRLAETKKLTQSLQRNETTLAELISQINRPQSQNRTNSRFLLVIDQFEELYTLCTNPQMRHRFLDDLLMATQTGGGYGLATPHLSNSGRPSFSIVLTMRADFLAQALTHRDFADALQQADVKLGPMTRPELERAIENPAGRQGVQFEKGLAARILDDVGDEPGRLPLLEFALTSLWDRQVGGLLTHDAYEASGRVEGALAHYADETFAKLSQEQQLQARRLFVQLVRPGEGTEDTRRIATRDELGQASWTLARQLADARLTVTGQNAAGQETAEVVHEALIRGWEKLRGWMKADRTFRAWQERLRQALQQWEASRRDEGALLRGVLLAEAEGWLAERQADLSPAEQEFIQASIALRQRRQAAQERQRRRVMLGLGAGLVVTSIGLLLVMVLAVVAFINGRQATQAAEEASQARATAEAEAVRAEAEAERAENQREIAEEQRQRAEAQQKNAQVRQLVAQTLNQAAIQPDLALLLSLEAGRIAPELQLDTQRSLLTALETTPQLSKFLRAHLGNVESVAFSPDGTLLASAGGEDDTIILWDVAGQKPARPPLADHGGAVNSLAFNPQGTILASGSDDGAVILWDVDTGQPLGQPLAGHTDWIKTVAFNRDGTLLASAGGDTRIILWNVATGQRQGQLVGHEAAVRSVVFSPTSNALASASNDETIILWDTTRQEPFDQPLTGHTDWVNTVAFSPDGQTLVSGSRDGTIILWNLTTRPYQRRGRPLTAHTNSVLSLAFSPDGQTLASASWDKTVILWDVATRQPLGRPLTGHTNWVGSVAFSPNGQTLASGSGDDSIILWDLTTRQRLAQTLAAQPAGIWSVAFSPDGQTLASASADETLILWDIATGSAIGAPLRVHTNEVLDVAFSPNGQLLASASADDTVILWDANSRQPLGSPLSGHTDWVRSVAFSPDGQILASGSRDGTIILWDVASRQPLGQPLARHTDWIIDLAFSPNGQTLASGSRDTTLILWDISDPSNPQPQGMPLTGHTDTVLSLAFSPNGQTLASGSWDKSILLWDVASRQPLGPPLTGHTGPVRGVTFSPNGQTLISGAEDGTLLQWDPRTGQQSGTPLTGHRRSVRSVAFSPTGELLAWGSEDETITLWDVASGERLERPLSGHTDWVNGLAFSPDAGLLFSGDGDGNIIVWDVEARVALEEPLAGHTSWIGELALNPEGTLLATAGGDNVVKLWDVNSSSLALRSQLSGHTAGIESVAFSPNGELLASASDDQSIILWDVATGRQRSQLLAHTDSINSVAFSPDGSLLASGSTDNSVGVWDVESGQLLYSLLVGHSSWVGSVAFNGDGTILASGGGDNRIILWDVKTGQQLGPPLLAHTAEVEGLTFAPDGTTLLTGGNDGAIIRWNVSVEAWQAQACNVAARNLNWDEWQQFIGDEPYRLTCPDTPRYLAEIYHQADIYAQAGQMDKAREAYEQAVEVALDTDAGGLNNNICWFGSLEGLAAVVLPACEYAVELAPAEDMGLYRDSRGVARALTGDIEGAIEDFEFFMEWSRTHGIQSQSRIKRHAWITALKEGQNPFDEATLTELRTE